MIFTYGDSHARLFVFDYLSHKNPELYKIHMRGGALAFNSLKYIEETINNLKTAAENDWIILSYGEVDMRAQVHKQVIANNMTYEQVIDGILQNYMAAVKIISDTYSKTKISLLNAFPAKKDPFVANPYVKGAWEFQGTDQERKTYTEYFNLHLKQLCSINNYLFFDIYDKIKNNEGYLIDAYTDGTSHLRWQECDSIYTDFINLHIL